MAKESTAVTLTDDEAGALKELVEVVDTKLAAFGMPPSSSPPEVWQARTLLKRLEGLAKRL